MTTRRAAIVAPIRTPVGTFGGSLRDVPVEDLAATAIKAVLDRTGIDPALIDDVSFAQSYVNGETPCLGRWAALHAGLPAGVPGITRDEADAYAARSHQRAAAAWAAGRFDDEVVRVQVPQRRGDPPRIRSPPSTPSADAGCTIPAMNPLSGVLDEAWRMYKTFAKHLLAIAFVIYLIAAIITALLALAGGIIGILLGCLRVRGRGLLLQATLVKAVQDVRDGRADLSISETVNQALPYFWPVAGASILAGIAIAIGLFLIIVPGLFLITIWAVIVPVIVIERSGVLASFGRSRAPGPRPRVARVRHAGAGLHHHARGEHRARRHLLGPAARARRRPELGHLGHPDLPVPRARGHAHVLPARRHSTPAGGGRRYQQYAQPPEYGGYAQPPRAPAATTSPRRAVGYRYASHPSGGYTSRAPQRRLAISHLRAARNHPRSRFPGGDGHRAAALRVRRPSRGPRPGPPGGR